MTFIKSSSLSFEQLEDRITPATQAFFLAGILSVSGDDTVNNIVVSARDDGTLQVTDNGTAVAIEVLSGNPTRANLHLAIVSGHGGNDVLTLDSSLNTPT